MKALTFKSRNCYSVTCKIRAQRHHADVKTLGIREYFSYNYEKYSRILTVNYKEFRRHLGKAGLTINEFSALIRVRPNSISNYAKKGNVPDEYAVIAVLVGEAADHGLDFRNALAKFGIRTSHLSEDGTNVSHLSVYRSNKKIKT